MSQRAGEPTSRWANKPTSRWANCLAPWFHRLHRHCTPFVPCWGEGTSSSSQHSSRRVLCESNKPTSQQANEPASQQANKPTSQQANEPIVWLPGFFRFVGIVLCSSCAGGRDPHSPPSMHGEGCFVSPRRTGTFLAGAGRWLLLMLLWQQDQHSRHSLLHSTTQHAPQHATQRPTQRATQQEEVRSTKAIVHCVHYQSYGVLLVCSAADCLEKYNVLIPTYFYQDEGHSWNCPQRHFILPVARVTKSKWSKWGLLWHRFDFI